jgi:hypothetical protein
LENAKNNIDNTLREKFENFAPPPPDHVWEGVAAGIAEQSRPLIAASTWKWIGIAASILLLIGFSFWWFMPREDSGAAADIPEENISTTDTKSQDYLPEKPSEAIADADESLSENNAGTETEVPEVKENITTIARGQTERVQDKPTGEEDNIYGITDDNRTSNAGDMIPATVAATETQIKEHQIYSVKSVETGVQMDLPESSLQHNPMPPSLITGEAAQTFTRGWSHGFYFTPEVMLNDYDSVDILPVYSFSYEPTFHVSNHFFVRTGLGVQYARDRGFGKIDFTRDEVVGTYEDVYDVTFDSVGGEIVPTYYTETRDIWDSVRHIYVSELTNKYIYLQVPLLFGYHNKGSKFNWYFYGGPAINFMVSRSIDDPGEGLQNSSIRQAENSLPERSDYYMQLWFGAGIEYRFARQLGLALEPTYRYYFDHMYKSDPYRKGLSSFGLRIGIVYKVK